MEQPSYDKSIESRKLYYLVHDGVLSSISQLIDGYPFGSVTPFCLDRRGRPVILISTLAQHTKNITANTKVSLTLTETVEKSSDVQAHGRLTYIGDAEKVPEVEVAEISSRYIRYLPAAQSYFKMHDFSFYRINMVKGRFIGGFGKIFWIEPEELLLDNPFSEEEEKSILDHMNDDHQHSMRKYLADAFDINVGVDNSLNMIGIDSIGCDIRYNGQIKRIWFDKPISNPSEARNVLTELARK